MKRVIDGILKKANNKASVITAVNGTPVEIVDLGKFKPGKGEFFDGSAELLEGETKEAELTLNDGIKAFYSKDDDGTVFISITDENVEAVENGEDDENLEEGVVTCEPEACGCCEPEGLVIAVNDIAVIQIEPKMKKDGTFVQFNNVTVYTNLAATLPGKFKAKTITSLFA